MPIRLPGLEIREPLKPRPVFGAIVGTVAGAVFALVADAGAFAVTRESQTMGFLGGGITAGAVVGSLAPLFRKRLSAGASVWLAATLGIFVANRSWHEFTEPLGSLTLGLIVGAVYTILFWDYRGQSVGARD